MSSDNKYWAGQPPLLAQSLLGMWFAASHQPWMNTVFIIQQLCMYPDWQQKLAEEIGDLNDLDYNKLQGLPLLDSFIKETVRLNPLDTSKPSFPTADVVVFLLSDLRNSGYQEKSVE